MEDSKIIEALSALLGPELAKFPRVKGIVKNFADEVTQIREKLSKMSETRKDILLKYEQICFRTGIEITYDVKHAIASATTKPVVCVAEYEFYAILPSADKMSVLTNFNAGLQDTYGEEINELRDNYKIILENEPHNAILVFYVTGSTMDAAKRIAEHFKDAVNFKNYDDKTLFTVKKIYNDIWTSTNDVRQFLEKEAKNIGRPVTGDMLNIKNEHLPGDVKPTFYSGLIYPRYYSTNEQTFNAPQTNNITINNTTIINIKTKGKKQFATKENIRRWIAENPPPENMKRMEYYNEAKKQLGMVKGDDFSNVVQENYKEHQANNSHYWIKK